MRLLAEQTLVECLDLLEAGESIPAILARHPESADALRPFLATAVQLSHLASQPTPAAIQKSQDQLLQSAAELRAATGSSLSRSRRRRILMALISIAIILLVVGVSLSAASATAVPGNALHGAQRLINWFVVVP